MTCVCHMVFLAHSTLPRSPVIASGTPFNQLTAETRLVSLGPAPRRAARKLNRHLAVTRCNFSTTIQEMNDAFRQRHWILSGQLRVGSGCRLSWSTNEAISGEPRQPPSPESCRTCVTAGLKPCQTRGRHRPGCFQRRDESVRI